ncbi:MAG: ankyrin repeat domain-containing protein, partial [Planctomycetota bacterium]
MLMRPSKWSPGVEPPWRDAVVGTIEVEQFVSRGATFRRLMVLPEDQIEPDEQSLPGSLPVWSLAFGERPAAHRADRLIGYEKSFGWPMRCLRTSWLIQEQSFALPGDGLRWGIRLKPVRWGLPDYSGMSIQPYMPYVETEEQRAFPLRPMLVGMALNTLIFGSGWFGVAWLVCLPGLLRIRWRRRQSRCVRCGYELDAAVTRCSECGHALSARLPVMARGAFVAVGLAGVLLLGGLAGLALWRTSGIRDVPPIHRAARDGDLATLEALADSGVDIDLVMPDGIEPLDFSLHRSTPLLLASAAGQNDAVSWLLGRGASPDGVSEWVAGPIGRASFRGHAEICRALLGAGASYGVDDAYGFAIAGRDLETIGVFRDHYGETAPSVALTSAVWHHPEVASELLGWHTWGDAAMASALDASIKTENVE